MSRRYAIKVAEMKELINALQQQIHKLNAEAESIVDQHREANLPVVMEEALGRLDVIEDLQRVKALDDEIRSLSKEVARRTGVHLVQPAYGGYRSTTVTDQVNNVLNGRVWQFREDSDLAQEIAQVCRERHLPPLVHSPYYLPTDLLDQFRACKSVNEIRQIINTQQREAVEHLRHILASKSTNTQAVSTDGR